MNPEFLTIFLIILVLVLQYNSFLKPLVILITVPLALIGVMLGLWATGWAMGFMAMLGVLSLAGIVINNAIVLIDRIQIEIDENGLDPSEAILTAAQTRLRPIVLTTATTIPLPSSWSATFIPTRRWSAPCSATPDA